MEFAIAIATAKNKIKNFNKQRKLLFLWQKIRECAKVTICLQNQTNLIAKTKKGIVNGFSEKSNIAVSGT